MIHQPHREPGSLFASLKIAHLAILSSAILTFAQNVLSQTQSLANYTVARSTGVTYNSISSSGYAVPSWRNSTQWVNDDNRSFPIPIGFDFWYNGVRYTTISVSTNGFVDFSSSTADGTITAAQTGQSYDSENVLVSTTSATKNSWNVLAPMYGDLTTQNELDPLGSSIKYLTTGSPGSRILTIEWINMSVWNNINTGTTFNFQVKIYESTGTIEFVYGTMTLGTATVSYTCAFNAASLAGGLTTAVLRTQQTVNTNTFTATPKNNLAAPQASNSMISISQTVPTAPDIVSPAKTFITLITTTSMQLNWNDKATNEVGYVVYSSTDGVNYSFVTQLAANVTSSNQSGLIPSTTYYWRVYAIREGALSSVLAGSATTSAPASYISAATGNWNTTTTWVGNVVPPLNAAVTIANGHTVTIDANITIASLTVGQGTSGSLMIGNNATARAITMNGDITINAGAQFTVNTASLTAGHTLTTVGNIINNGSFNLSPTTTSRCAISFVRNGNQTVSGSGVTTKIGQMTVNLGTTTSNVLEFTAQNVSDDILGFLTLTNGTIKLSTGATLTPFTTNTTLATTQGLWVNHSAAAVNTTGGSITVAGNVQVTAGTLNIGNAADNNLISSGGTITISGGNLSVAGRFAPLNLANITRFNMLGSSSTFTVNTVGSTSTTDAPFTITIVGSQKTLQGGTIIIQNPGANNLGVLDTASSVYTVSGGTLQIGNGSTPASSIFTIRSTTPLNSLLLNAFGSPTARIVASDLTVLQDVTISGGTLDANGLNLFVGGNWTDNGTFTAGTGGVTFNGSGAQGLTDPTSETFNNLTIAKSAGTLTLNNNVSVNGAFALTTGTLALSGSNSLTLNGVVTGAGTLTSPSTATVIYNRNANQVILGATYGNLTLSNTGWKAAATNLTVAGNFVLSGGTFSDSGFVATVNRNLANNALHTATTGSGGITLSGGTAAHALTGSGTYRNLTLNDAFGATLSGTLNILGTLTFSLGIINAGTDTVFIGSSGSITRTAGHVNGWLKKFVAAGANSNQMFEVGDAAAFAPISYTFSNVTALGYLKARTVSGDHPQIAGSGIDATKSVNRYWSVINQGSGLVFDPSGYNATYTFVSGDVDAGAVTSTFIASRYGGAIWDEPTMGTLTATSSQIAGFSAFGDFQIGQARPSLYIVSNASSLWQNASSWLPAYVPTRRDTAVILSPHTMTLSTSGTTGKLIINSGGTLADGGNTVSIYDSLAIDGTWSGTGTLSALTAGTNIRGTGAITSIGTLLLTGNKTIVAGSNLTGSSATVSIASGTVRNNGSMSMATLSGPGNWINQANSSLSVAGSLTAPLNATAIGNTVVYTGTGPQDVVAVPYYNLNLTGAGTKTMPGGTTTVSGSWQINGSANLLTNNANVAVGGNISGTAALTMGSSMVALAGNWLHSGTVTPGSSTINFNGATLQTFSPTAGTVYNNLTLSGVNTQLNPTTSIVVNGILTVSATDTLSPTPAAVISGAGTLTGSGTVWVTRTAGTPDFSSQYSITNKTLTNLTVEYNSTAPQTVSAVNYGNLTSSSTGTRILASTGTIGISGVFLPGANSYTNTGSTIDFNGSGPQSIPIFQYYKLTSSSSGARTLPAGIVKIDSLFTPGTNAYAISNNTIEYSRNGAQDVAAFVYNNVTTSGSGTKTAAGSITVNGDVTIGNSTSLDGGSFPHSINGHWTTNGSYVPSSSTVQFLGTTSAVIGGTNPTSFNVMMVNKATVTTTIQLNSSINVATLNMSQGTMITGANSVTITGNRTGPGIIVGTITRTHALVAGTSYAFESPSNTVTFSPGGTLPTSMTVVVTLASPGANSDMDPINRYYTLSQTAGSGFVYTLRLHYQDSEVGAPNSETSPSLKLWRRLGSSSSWVRAGATANDVSANWVETTGVDTVGVWCLSSRLVPSVYLSLSSNVTNPAPGTFVTYTVSYSNIGDGPATGTVLTLNAPTNTAYKPNSVTINGVGQTDNAGAVTVSGGIITVNLNTVAAGAGGTITYVVSVN